MADLGTIIRQDTCIVPVNITYYPVRARDNAINKLVGRFVKDMSARFEEELEVEGTMVMEGVDIDINFGKPISARDYLHSSAQIEAMLADDTRYLSPRVRAQEPDSPRRPGHQDDAGIHGRDLRHDHREP